ncbi:MAG TPA: Gx transporter family protein [Gammaproteobacteria bacterium]|nr:Gx transporter family protein [Gammaproteobacteria bacterium]
MSTTLTLPTTREDHRIAYLAALAITIHIAESALPVPLPGVKPGLANVVTVLVLLQFGWRAAAWVALLRVVVGSVLLGTFLSPTFLLSLSGALAALAALGLGSRLPGLGPAGYCVLAALAHMAAQFWTAYALFIPHPALLHLFPVFMTLALVFGLVSGTIAASTLRQLARSP